MKVAAALPKLKIKQFPDVSLLTLCTPVTEFDASLHRTLDAMAITMKAEQGIGLAGNQVGIMKRIFIMQEAKGNIIEFINPEILEQEGSANLPEGCLSMPGYYATLKRPDMVTIKAQNRHGEEFTSIAYGIEAVCASHECDHLNGIFFTLKEAK